MPDMTTNHSEWSELDSMNQQERAAYFAKLAAVAGLTKEERVTLSAIEDAMKDVQPDRRLSIIRAYCTVADVDLSLKPRYSDAFTRKLFDIGCDLDDFNHIVDLVNALCSADGFTNFESALVPVFELLYDFHKKTSENIQWLREYIYNGGEGETEHE